MKHKKKIDVLIYVEDPGAANYVAELPDMLSRKGKSVKLLAGGSAQKYLRERGTSFEAIQNSAEAVDLLSTARPGLFIAGTSEDPDTPGLAMIQQARLLSIPSAGVVDYISNAAHRFRGRSKEALAYAPDWLLLPDQWTRDAYMALGYPVDRAMVCGHPQYDYVRAFSAQLQKNGRSAWRKKLFPELEDERRAIVFVAEISTGLNPLQYRRSDQYTLKGRGESAGRTEVVLEEFLDAARLIKPKPYLVLRLHPKNKPDEFAGYLQEFDAVSSGGNPLELIYAADLIIGMSSMLLLEAVVMGRPTLSILPRPAEKDWLPTIKYGVPLCVTTREDLRKTLSEIYQDKSPTASPEINELFYTDSCKRVLAAIDRILEQR